MEENVIGERSKTKINFLKKQAQKSYYLGEYKENVIIALTDEEIKSGIIYPEIMEEMKKPTVASVKMRRDLPLDDLRPYILQAEKDGVRYTLVDELDLRGDIGLVVVSREPFDDNKRDVVVKNVEKEFENAGLSRDFAKNFGKKICKKHYEMVAKKLPQYKDRFKELGFLDKMMGEKCPIKGDCNG